MFGAGMHSMPAQLVVEETCKLFVQLAASYSITSSKEVVAFVEQMAPDFDQYLQQLHATAPVQYNPLQASAQYTSLQASAQYNSLQASVATRDLYLGASHADQDPQESGMVTDNPLDPPERKDSLLGKSSIAFRDKAQALYRDVGLDRRTKSNAMTSSQEESAKKRKRSRRLDDLRNLLLSLLMVYMTWLLPFMVGFDIDPSVTFITFNQLMELFFWGNIVLHVWDPLQWYGEGQDFDHVSCREKYLKFWLWFDIVAVFPFEIFAFAATGGLTQFFSRWRLNRMLNLVHFEAWFSHCLQRYARNTNPSMIRLYWMVIIAFTFLHVATCSLWGFAMVTDGLDHYRVFVGEENLGTGSTFFDYTFTFDIIIKMTCGFASKYPNTDSETYTCLALSMVGFTMYSYILGSVMTIISDFDAPLTALRNKLETVHDYLGYIGAPVHPLPTVPIPNPKQDLVLGPS